jgi:hypothetical protein
MVAKAVDDHPLEMPQQELEAGVRTGMGTVRSLHEGAVEINNDVSRQ